MKIHKKYIFEWKEYHSVLVKEYNIKGAVKRFEELKGMACFVDTMDAVDVKNRGS